MQQHALSNGRAQDWCWGHSQAWVVTLLCIDARLSGRHNTDTYSLLQIMFRVTMNPIPHMQSKRQPHQQIPPGVHTLGQPTHANKHSLLESPPTHPCQSNTPPSNTQSHPTNAFKATTPPTDPAYSHTIGQPTHAFGVLPHKYCSNSEVTVHSLYVGGAEHKRM